MKRLIFFYSGIFLFVLLLCLPSVYSATMTGGLFPSGFNFFDKVGLVRGIEATESNFNNNSYGISNVKLTFSNTPGILESDFSFRYGNSNTLSSWTSFSPANFDLDLASSTEAILTWDNPLLNGWLEVKYSTDQYLYFGNLVGDASLDGYVTPIDALSVINHINNGLTYSHQYDIDGDGNISPTDALIIINRLNPDDIGASIVRGPFGSGPPPLIPLPRDDFFFPNQNLRYELVFSNDTYTLTSTPVPEPATMLLLGTGLIGLAGFGRRKFKKNSI